MIEALQMNLIDHFLIGGKEFTFFAKGTCPSGHGLVAWAMRLEACRELL